ncbi:MAG: VOC family protein [Solirubrobacterales bacterium]|nr:VOC family protein [Solirubrobacterales bacterium]
METGKEILDEMLSVREGSLFVEGCRADDLAARFGTPLHVVSEDQLKRNADRFESAFGGRWPGPLLLLPSIKANGSLALRRILTLAGAGCDVFGPGEFEAALRTGTPPELISLNGPMKTQGLLERAIRLGARITLDDIGELEIAAAASSAVDRRAKVRLRIRPELSGQRSVSEMSPAGDSIHEAFKRYKAGIPTEDILALESIDPGLELCGLHFHIGRHSADPEVWVEAVADLIGIIEALRERFEGFSPTELDIGGGFPVPRDPFGRLLPQRREAAEDPAPGPAEFAAAICPALEKGLASIGVDPASVRLELEPGRSIYGDAGIHLASVGNVKRQSGTSPMTWVETDSSDAYLPDVNLEFNRWLCLAVDQPLAPPTIKADVTGRTCALDVIVPDAELPEVEAGDLLAFLDTGAYQDAGSHNFNSLPRPGTVLVSGTGAEMIRRHETIEDVFSRDIIPGRLEAEREESGEGWRPRSIDHVAVNCADIDQSIRFYSGVLGLEIRARGESDGTDEFAITGRGEIPIRWADIEVGEGQVIELIEFDGPRQPDPGNRNDQVHVALRVGDAEAVHQRIRDAGLDADDPVRIDTPGAWQGYRVFYATDPDGVSIELVQPA